MTGLRLRDWLMLWSGVFIGLAATASVHRDGIGAALCMFMAFVFGLLARFPLRVRALERLLVWLKVRLARLTLVTEFCKDCGQKQPLIWTADDKLWAEVTGRTDGGGVLCPECFDRRAVDAGFLIRWVPTVECLLARDGDAA